MLVYIVRHAIAVARESLTVVDDAARELTDKGIERMRQNVAALKTLDVRIDAIWSSPLLRARQTADLLVDLPSFKGDVRIVEALAPGGDLPGLVAELGRFQGDGGVAVVGHEPDLGELATLLVSGRSEYAVRFKKGGVACVDVEDGTEPLRGELAWLLTPKQMRAML